MGRLAGKTAFITGAASGIGREIAVQFADEGAGLVLADIDQKGLRKTVSITGDTATTVSLDVTSEKDWLLAAKTVRKSNERLDIVVNSAGISPDLDTIEDCSFTLWNKIVSVNLSGTFLGCQMAVDLMKATGGGSIINIGSVRSVVASPITLAYSTTKSGVLGLTKSVALHCAKKSYNIRANAICPGAITTAMHEDMLTRETDPDAALQDWISEYPIGRLGTAKDVALMAIYLASDESSFVTGANFMVDGGFTAR